MIIAIDGPAGAGKSTVARRIAKRLDAQLIDTGALYRAVGYHADKLGLDMDNPSEIAEMTRGLDFRFQFEDGQNTLFCNGEPVEQHIRTQKVGNLASQVSSYEKVRDALLDIQRDLGNERTSVLEGRDIGTVVFPDADAKYFVTASIEERARRRKKELEERGEDVDFDAIYEAIEKRDRRDRERETAPLKKANDAVEIDTTDMTIEEVVETIIEDLDLNS